MAKLNAVQVRNAKPGRHADKSSARPQRLIDYYHWKSDEGIGSVPSFESTFGGFVPGDR